MSKANTKNSVVTLTATAMEAATQTNLRASSANGSESAPSATALGGNDRSTGGSTLGSTSTSYHGSVGSSASTAGVNSECTTPIAASPPKAIFGLGAALVMPGTKAVAPKRQRRHGKRVTVVENCSGIDIDSLENSMGNNEAAKMLGMSGVANGIGMTQRPQSMEGITGQNGVWGTVTGPHELEWLTMSL